jgi:hypothetical protein
MNRILRPEPEPVHLLRDPAAYVREVPFAAERPPRESAAEAGEQRAADGALPKPLQCQCAAAEADEPSRQREALT